MWYYIPFLDLLTTKSLSYKGECGAKKINRLSSIHNQAHTGPLEEAQTGLWRGGEIE